MSEPDRWLTQVCGFPCFRVSGLQDGSLPAAADIARRMMAVAAGERAFLYAKLPTDAVGLSARLGAAGFMTVDTSITLERTAEPPLDRDDAVNVGPLCAEQAEAVQDIAARGFRFSRFHLDPLFPDALANQIKRAWIGSYCRGERGNVLYVAERDGVAAGFLAALQQSDAHGEAAVIDLIGVAPGQQGGGVGKALVAYFVENWRRHVAVLRVGTQAANIASLRFYQACGFRVSATSHVLHAHILQGKIVTC